MDIRHIRGTFRTLGRRTAVLLLAFLVTSCGQTPAPGEGDPRPPGDDGDARISGSLAFGATGAGSRQASPHDAQPIEGGEGARATVGKRPAQALAASSAARSAAFVPGEVIVRFASATMAPRAVLPSLDVQGVRLAPLRALGIERAALYRASTADRRATLALVDALNARPDVVYAQPNYILEPARVPGDDKYPKMWHYPFIGLEDAWDVTTGSADVVVAVLDTGMLMQHPDRPRNLLGGYDFVSSLSNLDGDGRDSDPTDPGPRDQTGYHGSHVIGTVAAATNNDYRGGSGADGIAGVGWKTAVSPVRVLGPSGTIADIADGIVWSAGESVSGVPSNPHPAHVINLSLGGPLPCRDTPALQDAINQATAAGSIVVAAAGNQIDDAGNYSPGSCTSVITVGASTIDDERAPYSNFGPVVDVMAPGGLMSEDRDGNGEPDGVLSLSRDDGAGTYGFMWMQGTSMATPHVAGVISLMLAVNPDLTRSEIRSILADTASAYSGSQCDAGLSDRSLSGSDCGAGLVDAAAAVQAAAGTTPPPPPTGDGELEVFPDPVVLGTTSSSRTVTLSNTGESSLTWELLYATGDPQNPAPLGNDVLFFSRLSGTLPAGGQEDLTVEIERANVSTPGAYTAYYAFDTDGDDSTVEEELPVTFIIEADDPTTSASGPTLVEAILERTGAPSGSESSSGLMDAYGFDVTPGSNFVYAWTDENGNGKVDAGDWYGSYDAYVDVREGEHVTDIDITLYFVQDVEAVRASLPDGVTLDDVASAPADDEPDGARQPVETAP